MFGLDAKSAGLICFLLLGLSPGSVAQQGEYFTLVDASLGTERDVLRAWSVPEQFHSSVTRLAVAVVLVADGTARVFRIDHDVRKQPYAARVCLDASRSHLTVKDFHELAIRHRGLKYFTHFRIILRDPSGREIRSPIIHSGPDHWRSEMISAAQFVWPEPPPQTIRDIFFDIRKEDSNQKGTLLIRWIRWR